MKNEYSATQTVYETVCVTHDALLTMSIEFLTDMVSRADGISDDGKLYRVEDHGGSHSWFVDVPIRKATEDDKALMRVIAFLKRKQKR